MVLEPGYQISQSWSVSISSLSPSFSLSVKHANTHLYKTHRKHHQRVVEKTPPALFLTPSFLLLICLIRSVQMFSSLLFPSLLFFSSLLCIFIPLVIFLNFHCDFCGLLVSGVYVSYVLQIDLLLLLF